MLSGRPDRHSDAILTGVLALLWIGASTVLTMSWAVPDAELRYSGQAIGVLFILVLMAWLWRTLPKIADPRQTRLIAVPRLGFYPTLALILGVFLALCLVTFAAHR